MTNKRMFALSVIDTDDFSELPLSAQALYFHIGMRADDDGFIPNVRSLCRVLGAKEKDVSLLAAKGFLLRFESGICVIAHWHTNNVLRADRYKKTVYTEELSMLYVDSAGVYRLRDKAEGGESVGNGEKTETESGQDGDKTGTERGQNGDVDQHRQGKHRQDQVSSGESSIGKASEGEGAGEERTLSICGGISTKNAENPDFSTDVSTSGSTSFPTSTAFSEKEQAGNAVCNGRAERRDVAAAGQAENTVCNGQAERRDVASAGDAERRDVSAARDAERRATVENPFAIPREKTSSDLFIPPTVDDVEIYCEIKGYHVDPEQFVKYYSDRHWMTGNAKIRDWKAVVRSWENSG